LGIDEPVAVSGASGLFLFFAGEATQAEQATDFGAGGIHFDGSLLGGKPRFLVSRQLGLDSSSELARMRRNAPFTSAVRTKYSNKYQAERE
jgi:hypothetical protein